MGHEALTEAQADLDKDLRHHGSCYHHWVKKLRPWLFAFRMYDQETKNGICIPKMWSTEIREMVGDALMISSLHRGMPEDVKAKYREDLLTDQHNDFMAEIHTAWHYYLQGFDVQWSPLGQDSCPEFRVCGGGLDFNVECRRFTWDLSEHVKTPALADTCDTIYEVLRSHNLWGEVRVEFITDFRSDPGRIHQWSEILARALDASQTTVELDPSVRLTLDLNTAPSRTYVSEELVALARDQRRPGRSFLRCKQEGELRFDPVVFRCSGPRKTSEQLRDYIYKTLKKKVTTQLSPDRAGVIVARFNGIRDPHVFIESKGINDALSKLFERQHLAAVVMQCEGIARSSMGSILCSTPSIVFRNLRTTFPQVAEANHLS
ncbi:MAG: hypothetical protein H7Y39_07920 [Nitrospiraceae bacterium]|nr:hypothetical protein [Nitrospiraceae bacterium]